MNLINKVYRLFLSYFPTHSLKHDSQVKIVFWCSDLTHVREQIHVAKNFDASEICFVSNKKDIIEFIHRNYSLKVFHLNFNESISHKKLSKLISSFLPNLQYAIIGNDFRNDDALIGAAIHHLGIKYGVITHGLNFLHTSLSKTKANHYFVWSAEEKKRFEEQGVSANSIVVSGSPYFFYLSTGNLNIPDDWKNTFTKKYAFKNHLTTVCLSGPGGLNTKEQHTEQLSKINQIAGSLGLTFCANLHRKDRADFYTNLEHIHVIESADKFDFISKLVPILSCSEVVISGASTSVIEAMCLNVPVIFFDTNKHAYNIPYAKENYVAVAHHLSELEMLLKRIYTDINYRNSLVERQQQFLKEYIITEKKSPAQVIVQYVKEAINNDSKNIH